MESKRFFFRGPEVIEETKSFTPEIERTPQPIGSMGLVYLPT